MTGLFISVLIAVASLLALVLAATLSRINILEDEDDAPVSADHWWEHAERIKAAVAAADAEGIERIDISRITKEG